MIVLKILLGPLTLIKQLFYIIRCEHLFLTIELEFNIIKPLCIIGHNQYPRQVIPLEDYQHGGIPQQPAPSELSHQQHITDPKHIKPLGNVVNPCAIDELLVVVVE